MFKRSQSILRLLSWQCTKPFVGLHTIRTQVDPVLLIVSIVPEAIAWGKHLRLKHV